MPDLASEKAGGCVVMVSSLDSAHPGENVIDGNNGTYWISTGLFPQEVLLQLGQPTKVASVRLSSTRVRGVRFEACPDDTPMNFKVLAEAEVEDSPGALQMRELRCGEQEQPTEFVRLLILSGWDDFCSVHSIQVDGVAMEPPARRHKLHKTTTGLKKPGHDRTKELEVTIPEQMQKDNEPDAPRKHDSASAWRDVAAD
mmetsp:Transcript_27830/g.88450  ORF Transcript_27830/g.88450 Transcript_27830/m.88450 type:complete len:199 (-) Transcript_27830:140-736(-)